MEDPFVVRKEGKFIIITLKDSGKLCFELCNYFLLGKSYIRVMVSSQGRTLLKRVLDEMAFK